MRFLFLLLIMYVFPVATVAQPDSMPLVLHVETETDNTLLQFSPGDTATQPIYSTENDIFDVTLSPGGRYLAFIEVPPRVADNYTGNAHGERPGILYVIDMAPGGDMREIAGQPTQAEVEAGEADFVLREGVSFSPDSRVMTWGENNTLVKYDFATDTMTTLTRLYPSEQYSRVGYPDLVWGEGGMVKPPVGFDPRYRVYDPETGGYTAYELPDIGGLRELNGVRWSTYDDRPVIVLGSRTLLFPDDGVIMIAPGAPSALYPGGIRMEADAQQGVRIFTNPDGATLETPISEFAVNPFGVLYVDGETLRYWDWEGNPPREVPHQLTGEIDLYGHMPRWELPPGEAQNYIAPDVVTDAWVIECPLPANVGRGSVARVVEGMGVNMLRDEPAATADTIGTIPPGGVFWMERARGCVQDNFMWYSAYYNGMVGFTAAGDPDTGTYWVEPAPDQDPLVCSLPARVLGATAAETIAPVDLVDRREVMGANAEEVFIDEVITTLPAGTRLVPLDTEPVFEIAPFNAPCNPETVVSEYLVSVPSMDLQGWVAEFSPGGDYLLAPLDE